MKNNWISGTAIKDAPEKLDQWSTHLRYIWNQSNPAAANVVILTLYETFAVQTLVTKLQQISTNRIRKVYSLK